MVQTKPTKRPKRVTDVRQALSLLAARGALTLVPDLVEAVAGERVRGSWWAHPAGKRVYAIATELERHPDVTVGKLVQGRVTFLHASMWPALLRVVGDPSWRRQRRALLSTQARELLTRVTRAGRVAVVDAAPAQTRAELETSLLVRSFQEHGPRGRHHAVLETWQAWAPADALRAARELSLDQALTRLAARGIDVQGA